MDEERISKKELLEITGISYGQLYRWKRERLIPEEWFVKQSSFTGQETYFPREKILARINSILERKDNSSLEEMAKVFSPNLRGEISAGDLVDFEPINSKMFEALQKRKGAKQIYEAGEVVFLAALSNFLGKDGFDIAAAIKLIETTEIREHAVDFEVTQCYLLKLEGRKNDFHVVFCPSSTAPLFDTAVEILGALALQETAEQLGNYIQSIRKNV
jgi:hypothetical protein